jgi:hypothetical protein
MSVDAEIRPNKSGSLGTAKQVCAALEAHFPGIAFVRFENSNVNHSEIKSFTQRLLQSWMKVKFVGPTAPFAFQGDMGGKGWSMQASFDDTEFVPVVYLSLYGKFDVVEPQFETMFKEHPWKLKVC